MTSREFLNVAHAALVEEFMRPRTVKGITVGGLSLEEALEAAAPWAEGFGTMPPLYAVDGEDEPGVVGSSREKTEEEIVEQNNRALKWLESRMSGVKGGFGTVPSSA